MFNFSRQIFHTVKKLMFFVTSSFHIHGFVVLQDKKAQNIPVKIRSCSKIRSITVLNRPNAGRFGILAFKSLSFLVMSLLFCLHSPVPDDPSLPSCSDHPLIYVLSQKAHPYCHVLTILLSKSSPRWLVLTVMFWPSSYLCPVLDGPSLLSCSDHPLIYVLSRMARPYCHALTILLSMSCPDWPIPADFQAELCRLSCPTVLFWLSCHGCPLPKVACLSCPFLTVMFWPSYPGWPVRLTCPGWPDTADLTWLSYLDFPDSIVLLCHATVVLLKFSCSKSLVRVLLFRFSCLGFLVQVFLFWFSCSLCFVLVVLLFLVPVVLLHFCSDCLV